MMSLEELKIDEEFAALIPPLRPEEFVGLEQSIINDGCREAIIVWNDIIIDGHNRYKICKTHNLEFHTAHKDFADRNAVMVWMLQNQLGRRNLNDFQRVELVRKCEDAVKAQALQRMLAGKADLKVILPEGQESGIQSRDELGKLAGVSGSTYEHATKVLDEAPEPVVEAARNKEISINAAYEVTKMPEAQQTEIAERINQGEAPKKVVSEVKARKKHSTNTEDTTIQPTAKTLQHEDESISTTETYKIIYVAPTWEGEQSAEELCKLPVQNIADENCALFLWTDGRNLNNAMKVIAEWGFTYRTVVFVRTKLKLNDEGKEIAYCDENSNWTRENCDFCLLATRGVVSRVNDNILQYCPITADDYNLKPDKFKELAVELLGDLPTLELFPTLIAPK